MPTGTVKWFDRVKGYGVISPDDDSGDLLVESTGIAEAGRARMLAPGQRVEFTVVPGARGDQAEDVHGSSP